MTMLEKAARAVAEEVRKHDLTYDYGHDNGAYEAIVRAALVAVLPTLERVEVEEQGPCGRGWLAAVSSPDGEYVRYDDLQAILNDGEGE